jgi:hypothetical protein
MWWHMEKYQSLAWKKRQTWPYCKVFNHRILHTVIIIKTKVFLSLKEYVTLADFGNPVYTLWFFAPKYFKIISLSNFDWAYMIKAIPEMCRVHQIRYLHFHSCHIWCYKKKYHSTVKKRQTWPSYNLITHISTW